MRADRSFYCSRFHSRRLVSLTTAALSLFSFLSPAMLTAGAGDDPVSGAVAPVLLRNGLYLNDAESSVGYSALSSNTSTGNSALGYGNGGYGNGGYGNGLYSSLSLSAGYSHITNSGSFSITYLPSYLMTTGQIHYHSFDQNLNLAFLKRLSVNSTLSVTSQAESRSLPQLLFNAPAGAALESAQAVGSNSLGLAATPYALTLYGQRVLTLSGFANYLYHYSSRLNFTAIGGYSQSQSLPGSSSTASALLSRSRAESGSFGASYSLDTRTSVGGDVSYSRADGNLFSYQGTTVSGSLARKLGKRWSLGGSGGIGYYLTLGRGLSWVGGGTLAYGGREHSFSFKANRAIGNTYGLGARTTTDFDGTWSWRLRNRSWSTFTSGGEQELSGGPFPALRFWMVNTGITRELSQGAVMSLGYVHMGNLGMPAGLLGDIGSNAVRMTFAWYPSRRNSATPPNRR